MYPDPYPVYHILTTLGTGRFQRVIGGKKNQPEKGQVSHVQLRLQEEGLGHIVPVRIRHLKSGQIVALIKQGKWRDIKFIKYIKETQMFRK